MELTILTFESCYGQNDLMYGNLNIISALKIKRKNVLDVHYFDLVTHPFAINVPVMAV